MRASLVALVLVLAYFGPELYFRLLRPKASWDEHRGDFALVTGSSYGIGRSMALGLARRGVNVILHGRTEKALVGVRDDILKLYPSRRVEMIIQDVTDDSSWSTLVARVSSIPNVTVLINNVGGGASAGNFVPLHQMPLEEVLRIHRLNYGAALRWTHALLPQMAKEKRGKIIQCSSLATAWGWGEGPYGADKWALHGMSISLNNEYSEENVRAETLLIGIVGTPAFGGREADWYGYALSSDWLSERALDMWGMREVYAPGTLHAVLHWFGMQLPVWMRSQMAASGTKAVEEDIIKGKKMIQKIHTEL